MVGPIDGKVYGLQSTVVNDLKKGPLTRERVLDAVSKDGVIDNKEQELLNEIEAGQTEIEVSDKSDIEMDKSKSGSAEFDPTANKTSFKLDLSRFKPGKVSLSEAATQRANSLTMRTRADARRQLGKDIDTITRTLDADKAMVDNPGQARINLESARKMMVQDVILLEKLGTLSSDEKQTLDSVLTFMRKNITKPTSMKTLRAQSEALAEIVKKHAADLKGANPSSVLAVDQGNMAVLNADTGSDISKDMAVVDQNYDALLAAGDAAADDVKASTLETGLNSENMQGAKVNAGRNFGRMMEAIDEADKQFTLLSEKAIPTVEKYIADRDAKIDQRMQELYGVESKEDAQKALQADPAKAQGDAKLQELIRERSQAVVKYQALADKAKSVAEARKQGLKTFSSIKQIHSSMVARVNDIQLTGSNLSVSYGKLASLKGIVQGTQAEIAKISAKAKEIEAGDAKDKKEQLALLKSTIDAQKKNITGAEKEVESARKDMQTGLQELYKKLESNGATATELKLVQKQVDTLASLKLSGGSDLDSIAKDLDKLEAVRTSTLNALKDMVPARLDIREFNALTSLDKKVTTGSRSVLDVQREIRSGKFSATAAKESIDLAIKTADSDIGAAESMIGKAKALEDPKKGGYVGLAYGSHFGVELWAGAGVGADIGVAEAKITASLNAALKVSKDFEHGERPYRLQVDLGIKVEGDLTIAKIFDAHAEIKAGLSAGLAFKDLGEVGEFAGHLGKIMGLAHSLKYVEDKDDIDRIKASMDKEIGALKKTIKEKGYTGKYVEVGAQAKSELPGAEVGAKGNWRRQVNTYSDGQKVQTDNYMGKVSVGHFGVKVTHNRSKVVAEHGKEVHDKPVSHRTAVHFTIPTEMISHALHHGGFKNLPQGLVKEVVSQFKALNPNLATFSTGMVLSHLDTALSKANGNGSLAKILDMAKTTNRHSHSHSHGEVEIAVGIEYVEHWHNDKHGEGYFAVEFGVEAEKEYTKDIPIGSVGHLRFGAKASAELGIYVKVPGTKTELHPHGSSHGADHPPKAEAH